MTEMDDLLFQRDANGSKNMPLAVPWQPWQQCLELIWFWPSFWHDVVSINARNRRAMCSRELNAHRSIKREANSPISHSQTTIGYLKCFFGHFTNHFRGSTSHQAYIGEKENSLIPIFMRGTLKFGD
jgi:hypothetical protein